MDRLILFRHGKAERQSAAGGDFDRRLTEGGAGDAAAVARRLAALGVEAARALVSPSVRTRETWAAAAPFLPGVEASETPALYDAEAEAIRAIAEQASEAPGAVIVVGHNPGLQDLTVALMQAGGSPPEDVGRAMRAFPPAAAAVFRIDARGRPAFEALILPPGRV